MDNTREFKVLNIIINDKIIIPEKNGKYIGRGPLQAVRKAVNTFCVKNKLTETELDITLKETTLNTKNKIYKYTASRKLLPESKKVVTNSGKEYTINHEIIIKSKNVDKRKQRFTNDLEQ